MIIQLISMNSQKTLMGYAITIGIFKHCEIEFFRMKNKIAPAIMQSMLNRRVNTYTLRNFQDFVTGRKKSRLIWSANAQLPKSSTLVSFA